MGDASLVVSEVFGPTVQGEGPSTGRRCAFIRLGACNLTCTWCDTWYTWDASRADLRSELHREPVASILATVAGMRVPMVVISGGEPLLQQGKGLNELLAGLAHAGLRIEVETNGTIAPSLGVAAAVDQFNVSPKLEHSGVGFDDRYKPAVLRTFAGLHHAVFKFVCATVADLDEVGDLAASVDLERDRCWIMAEGVTSAAVGAHLGVIADEAIRLGYNITGRLHVDLWEGQRAR